MSWLPKDLADAYDDENYEASARSIIEGVTTRVKAAVEPVVQAAQPAVERVTTGASSLLSGLTSMWDDDEADAAPTSALTAPYEDPTRPRPVQPAAATVAPAAMPTSRRTLPSTGQTLGDVNITTGPALPSRLDTSSREANLQQWAPTLQAKERELGMAPGTLWSIIQAENGGGQSPLSANDNNYFSISAVGRPKQAGAGTGGRFARYNTPQDSLDDFLDLVSTSPRYAEAWANRGDPERFFDGLVKGGYIVPEPGFPVETWRQNLRQGREYFNQAAAPGDVPFSSTTASPQTTAGEADRYDVAFGFNQAYDTPFNPNIPRHRGVDLVVRGGKNGGRGEAVRAFRGGKVVAVTSDPNGGNGIIVATGDPDAPYDRYFHFDAMNVEQGQEIKPGEQIGVLGASGTEGFPHLHYEVSRGINGDPMDQLIDPTPYMRSGGGVRGAQVATSTEDASHGEAPVASAARRAGPVPMPQLGSESQPTMARAPLSLIDRLSATWEDPDQGPREATPGSKGAEPLGPVYGPEPTPEQASPDTDSTNIGQRIVSGVTSAVQDAGERVRRSASEMVETVTNASPSLLLPDPERPGKFIRAGRRLLGIPDQERDTEPVKPPPAVLDPEMTYGDSIQTAVRRGTINYRADVLEGVGQFIRGHGIGVLEPVADYFESDADRIRSYLHEHPELSRRATKDALDGPQGLVEAVAESAPSILPTVLAALLSGGGSAGAQAATILSRGNLALGALSAAGSQARELRDENLSPETKGMLAAGAGLTEVVTEMLFPGADAKMVRGMAGDVAKRFASEMRKRGLLGAGREIAREFGQEAVEEAVAESYGVAVDAVFTAKKPTLTEAARRIGGSALVGGVSGAAVATPAVGIQAVADAGARRRVGQDIQDAGRGLAEEGARQLLDLTPQLRAIGDETGGTPLPGMPARTNPPQRERIDRNMADSEVAPLYSADVDDADVAHRALDIGKRFGNLEEVVPLARALREAKGPVERGVARRELLRALDEKANSFPDTSDDTNIADYINEKPRSLEDIAKAFALKPAAVRETLKRIEEDGQRVQRIGHPGVSPRYFIDNATEADAASEVDEPKAEAASKHEYSSTQLDLPKALADRVRTYSKNAIADADLHEQGREADPHVTVKYGLTTENADDVRRIVEAHGPIPITLGKVSTFEKAGGGKFDVVKVDVTSPELRALNAELSKLDNEDEHPTYQPHLTLAYVKPGKGAKYKGSRKLDGIKTTISELTFSSKNGEKVTIHLLGQPTARTNAAENQPASAAPTPGQVGVGSPGKNAPEQQASESDTARSVVSDMTNTGLAGYEVGDAVEYRNSVSKRRPEKGTVERALMGRIVVRLENGQEIAAYPSELSPAAKSEAAEPSTRTKGNRPSDVRERILGQRIDTKTLQPKRAADWSADVTKMTDSQLDQHLDTLNQSTADRSYGRRAREEIANALVAARKELARREGRPNAQEQAEAIRAAESVPAAEPRATVETEGASDGSRGRVSGPEQERASGADRGALADTRQGPVSRAEEERRAGERGAAASGRDDQRRPEPPARGADRQRSLGGRDAADRARPAVAPAERLEAAPATADVVMTDDDLAGRTPVERWNDNISALKILMKLRAEQRGATIAEQRALARYSGFGDSAFEHAFRPAERQPNPAWKKRGDELRALVPKAEYEAIRESRINANYTSAEVVGAMWGALQQMGLTGPGLRVLDPSAGSGRFFGLMPPGMAQNASRWMVELDTMTGELARALFPQASVQITGFESARIPADSFDLAISNVPFSKDVRIGRGQDPSIPAKLGNLALHNYFFFKALQAVRPGGVVAFITTHQTLDARTTAPFRRYLAGQADLLGAIRLPQDAFVDTAVTTDIIFLKKRAAPSADIPAWVETESRLSDASATRYDLNRYFVMHPEMALGEHTTSKGRGLYRGDEYRMVKLDGDDLNEALRLAVDALPADVFTPTEPDSFNSDLDAVNEAHDAKPGAYVVKAGKLGQRILKVHDPVTQSLIDPPNMIDAAKARVIRMMDVRDAARAVLSRQLDPAASDASVKQAQATLARAYDGFVREYGPISEGYNQGLLRTEPDAPLLRALERRETLAELRKRRISEGRKITSGAQAGKIEPKPWPKLITAADVAALKMPIFTERVITPIKHIDSAETAADALAITLNERGAIDAARMSQLLAGRPEAEILDELVSDGVLFRDPDGGHKLAEEYLSGDVVAKLAQAEEAAETDGAFSRNTEALKAVQPQPLKASEVSIRLGAPWVPEADVNAFVQQLLEGRKPPGYRYLPALGQWTREERYYQFEVQQALNNGTYGTQDISAIAIIDRMLAGKDVVIRTPDPDDPKGNRTIVDADATQKAQAKVREIRTAWMRWLRGEPERLARLVDLYNDKFNREVPRSYDGRHLTFPGMAQAKPPREHQRNVVWRTIQNGTVLMAHEVGAGKTIAMAAAAMELRRLGISRKNLFVVPNHLVGQFAQEFLSAYPSANVLVPRPVDFQAKNRQELMARIATGDYDAIVVAQSQFTLLPISPERQEAMIRAELAELEAALREEEAAGGYGRAKSQSEKELIKAQKRLKSRLLDMQGKIAARQDKALMFEDLGVDALFVDEADLYKNLQFVTRKTRVKGLPNAKSQRAFDMHAKTSVIREGHGGRGVVFATGTPVSNTIAELWTMLRYLAPEALDRLGVTRFDAWADTFGDTITQGEMTVTGKFQMVTRFAQFQNAAELNKLFQIVADIVTEEDMPELAKLKPKLRGGERIDVTIPPTAALQAYMKSIEERANNLKNVDPTEDNMLLISSDARKAALDVRLVNPRAPDDPNGKIERAAEKIAEVWQREAKKKGTQLVFLDMGTPKALSDEEIARLEKAEADSLKAAANAADDAESVAEEEEVEVGGLTADEQRLTSDVYSRIKAKLTARGIPADQIAFIHDAKTKVQKQKLFDAVNDGTVRVLLGSTEKLGAGTNVQARLAALHHIDAPWRPRDVEQREGRILRQGNRVYGPDGDDSGIEIYRYLTEGSFDSVMWSGILAKAKAIKSMVRRHVTARTIEDADEFVLSAATAAALATGNPDIVRYTEMKAELGELEGGFAAHQDAAVEYERIIQRTPHEIAALEGEIAALTKARTEIEAEAKKGFVVTIGGQRYTKREAATFDALLTALQKTYGKQDWTPIAVLYGSRLEGRMSWGALIERRLVRPDGTVLGEWRDRYNDLNGRGQLQSAERASSASHLDERVKLARQMITRKRSTQASAERQKAQAGPFEQLRELERLRADVPVIEQKVTAPPPDRADFDRRALATAQVSGEAVDWQAAERAFEAAEARWRTPFRGISDEALDTLMTEKYGTTGRQEPSSNATPEVAPEPAPEAPVDEGLLARERDYAEVLPSDTLREFLRNFEHNPNNGTPELLARRQAAEEELERRAPSEPTDEDRAEIARQDAEIAQRPPHAGYLAEDEDTDEGEPSERDDERVEPPAEAAPTPEPPAEPPTQQEQIVQAIDSLKAALLGEPAPTAEVPDVNVRPAEPAVEEPAPVAGPAVPEPARKPPAPPRVRKSAPATPEEPPAATAPPTEPTVAPEPSEDVRYEQTESRLPTIEAMFDEVTPEAIDSFLPEDAPEGTALAIYERLVDSGRVVEGEVIPPQTLAERLAALDGRALADLIQATDTADLVDALLVSSPEVVDKVSRALSPRARAVILAEVRRQRQAGPSAGPTSAPPIIEGQVVGASSKPSRGRRGRPAASANGTGGTTPPTPPPPTGSDNPGADRPEDSGDAANASLGRSYKASMKNEKRLSPGMIEAIRRAYVRAMTDDRIDLNLLVEEIEREHGRLPAAFRVDLLARMSPGMAAKVNIDEGLKPHLRGLSDNDLAWLDVFLTHMDNLDVARAMGIKAEQESLDAAGPFRGKSWRKLQEERQRLRAFEPGGLAPNAEKAAASAKKVRQLERQVQRDEVRHQQKIMRRAAQRRGRVESERLFSEGLTVADSHRALGALARELGPRRLAKIQKAAAGVWEFNRSLLQAKVENDVISQELYDELVARYPHYVPTRIVDYLGEGDAGGPAVGKSLSLNDTGLRRNTLEGTRRRRENPLASTYRNAIETERIVKQNQVALAMKLLIDSDPDGLGQEFREAPSDYTLHKGEGYLTGYERGVKFRYVTGEPMSKALKVVSASPVHGFFLRFMHVWKEMITRFPLFIAYQVPQDAASYALREVSRASGNPLSLPGILTDLAISYGIAFRGLLSGEYKGSAADYLKSGGGMAGFNMRDIDTAKEKVYALTGKKSLATLARQGILFNWSQAIGERIELAPRVASYRRAKRRGASEVEATVAGRDVTLDFLRGGYFARYLNGLLGFFNVGAQASASIPRMWRENPRGFALMSTMMLGGAILLEAMMAGDDDEEWEDIPSYIKDRGLLFLTGGTSTMQDGERRPRALLLPVRELAPLLILGREAVRRFQGKEGRSALDLIGSTLMAASPIQANSASDLFGGFFPELLATPSQLAIDQDFFRGGPIKTKRNDEQASSLSKGIASALQFIGDRNETLRGLGTVSPSQVEFAARGFGGHFARTVGAASDVGKDRGAQDRGPIDTPLVGGLVGRFVTDAGGERLRKAQDESKLISLDVRRALRDAKVTAKIGTVQGTIEGVPLRRAEQARYQELANAYTDRELRALLRTADFKTARGVARAKLVEQAIAAGRTKAREQVMTRIPAAEQERRKRAAERKAG